MADIEYARSLYRLASLDIDTLNATINQRQVAAMTDMPTLPCSIDVSVLEARVAGLI